MIFAHGSEEIEYLESNLIKVNVIPGITTASALAASQKISLTHRDFLIKRSPGQRSYSAARNS